MKIRSQKVLIKESFTPADIVIENGYITEIAPYGSVGGSGSGSECRDLGDLLVMPGIIDLHSDALEKEIEPRPNAHFPLEFAIKNLDKKLAAAGITTMFHAIGFEENPSKHRNSKLAKHQIEEFITHRDSLLVDNRIHARFEISSVESLPDLYECLNKGWVDILSIMDHTPGQGQFKSIEAFSQYYAKHHGFSESEIAAMIDKKGVQKDMQALEELLSVAREKHIALLSHDDDCKNKLDKLHSWGVKLSEFPLSLEVAQYALSLGLITGMGAPNVVRGGSQSGNVAAMDLIKEGACSYLCSDYHPHSMLYAAFKIARENPHIPLAKAFSMITATPAKAIGLEDRGALAVGKRADIIVVREAEFPEVVWSVRGGQNIYYALHSLELQKGA
ncbi:alpha-D-ribose 1-methylphosphonate 5-triphosphate diphosphatase [uncultured Helicobacter sp.]|uniref:alpha-D-ribose 1-methylphosphonate 5-triphosphate diphosphatase n=1 Tax=uncultured Helicobacter sp. TaxID=175537 RepID=UPI003751D7F9